MEEWICSECGAKCEIDIEELYLEALIKDAGLKIARLWCPLCSLKHRSSSPFTFEEGLKILELVASREAKNGKTDKD